MKFGAYTIGKLFKFLRCPLDNFRWKVVHVEILVHGVGHTYNIKNCFIFQFLFGSGVVEVDGGRIGKIIEG